MLFFSHHVYSRIPYVLGGGKPLTVIFLFRDPSNAPLGIEADESGRRSVPYELVLATDHSYFVLSPEERELSLEISRVTVLGLAVLAEEPKSSELPSSTNDSN